MRLRRLSSAVGVELQDVDVPSLLRRTTASELRSLCLEHSILVIRGQSLSLTEQVAFAQCFGTVLGDTSQANFVRSVGELEFHFDHWLVGGRPEPLAFTNLYAIEVPAEGGATVFSSTVQAYRCLPNEICTLIAKLSAEHVYDYSDRTDADSALRVRAAELPPGQPNCVHPLIRAHPQTGARTLYVSPRNTDRVVGLHANKSEALLTLLFETVKRSDISYVHLWQPGDLVIWDNHAVLHARRPYDVCHPRRLRRFCIR